MEPRPNEAGISPKRQAPWYCTYCGDQHPRDAMSSLDPRYATGLCGTTTRQLVRDQDLAQHLCATVGKNRPEGVPLGGHQVRKPVLVPVAPPGVTAKVQAGKA